MMSLLNSQQDCEKPRRQPKYSSRWRRCQVCADRAYIINYGALSCQSCKTFFRRNGRRSESIRPCFFNHTCNINTTTRRKCTNCRLTKCFLVGMSSDLIRKEEQQKTKHSPSVNSKLNKSELIKQEMDTSPVYKLGFSYDSQYILVNSEQKLLSNIVHASDTYSALPQIHHIISNLSTSYLDMHINTKNILKSIILSYISTGSFINSTPDFRILTINEQCSLIERNLNGISVLYWAVMFRDLNIIDNYLCMKILMSIFGLDVIQQVIRFRKQLDADPIMINMMLIILAFSSNCSMVDSKKCRHNDSLLYGTHRLFGSQDVYIELLWKYMISHYGYYVSTFRFARLMKLVLGLMKISANIYMTNKTYGNLVNDVMEDIKQLLINNQNEPFSLWGKV
ncbi:hypothetical protein I4U23_023645 [Adineta vaga]|nr:hypothetical protein I4U23_023645 [Adineta vaga]